MIDSTPVPTVTPGSESAPPPEPPPPAPPPAFSTPEESSLTIPLGSLGAAPTGAPVVVVPDAAGVVNGTALLTDGGIVFTPTPDFSGDVDLIVPTANGSQTVTVTVAPVNDAPDLPATNAGSTVVDTGASDPFAELSGTLNGTDRDGPTLTYGILGVTPGVGGATTQTGLGTLTVQANGAYTFVPNPAAVNALPEGPNVANTFLVQASDGIATTTSTLTVTFDPANDVPTITAGATLPYEEGQAPTAIDNNITVADVDSAITGATVSIGSFAAGDVLGFTAQNGIAGSFNGETGVLTLSGAATAAQYAAVLRSVTYENTSAAPTGGTRTITFAVTDGQATSTLATSTVIVTALNDAPTTAPVVLAALAEDGTRLITQADLLANAEDADGDDLTATDLAIAEGGGSLEDLGNGTWLYTPAADDDGAVSFTYTVTDGLLDAPGTATLDLTPVNDAPDVPPTITGTAVQEDAPATVVATLNAVDPDGPPTIYTFTNQQGGTFTRNAEGQVLFTPAANFNGTATATYTASDGTLSDSGIISVAVTGVNDAPSGTDNTITIAEDGARTFAAADFGFTDVDGNALQAVIITTLPTAGTLRLGETLVTAGQSIAAAQLGGLVFTPAANASGLGYASFTFQVVDNGGTANGGVNTDPTANTITINVTGVNDAPVAVADTLAATEDTPVIYTAAQLLGNDTDLDNPNSDLRIFSVTSGTGGTAVLNENGTVTFTPNANFNGAANFTYVVSDGIAQSAASATVTVNVAPVNDAPSGTDNTITIAEDGARTFAAADFGFTDVDGNALQAVIITTLPTAGTLRLGETLVTAGQSIAAAQLGGLVFTPAANASGLGYASFTFQVVDNGGTANGGVNTDPTANTITINVTGVNDAPVAVADTLAATEDTPVIYTAAQLLGNDTDLDNPNSDLRIFSVTSGTGGTAVLDENGTVTFTPNANFNGAANFTYVVSDGIAQSAASATVTVNVAPVNDAPSVDLNGPGPAGNAGANFATTFTENGQSVSIADIDAAVTDVDDQFIESATVTLTNAQLGDSLAPNGTLPDGIAFTIDSSTPGVITLTLTGTATPAAYQAALQQIVFSNSSDNPVTAPRDVTVVVSDGSVNSNVAHATITVTAINDGPVFTTAQFGFEDAALSGWQRAGVVSQVEGGTEGAFAAQVDSLGSGSTGETAAELETFLGIPAGTLAAVNPLPGDGSALTNPTDGSAIWRDVQLEAGQTLRFDWRFLTEEYPPFNDFGFVTIVRVDPAGSATVSELAEVLAIADSSQATIDDTGWQTFDGFTAPTSGTYRIGFGVVDAGDEVVFSRLLIDNIAVVGSSGAATITVQEDTPTRLTGISVADVDAGDAAIVVTLSLPPGNGSLSASDGPGVAVGGTATAMLTLTGTVAAISAFLADPELGVRYTPAANSTADVTLTVTANDGGATGEGGPLVGTTSILLDLVAANDGPTAVDDAFTTAEDTAVSGDVLANDTDLDGDPLTAVLEIGPANGTLALNEDGSFTYTPDADFTGTDSFTYTVTDADGDGDSASVTITVNAVNDAPVLALDPEAIPTVATDGNPFPVLFFPVITDVDDQFIEGAKITLTNRQLGDAFFVPPPALEALGITFSITESTDQIVIALTGSATGAAYEEALSQISLSVTGFADIDRRVAVTVNDGEADSLEVVSVVEVTENQPPLTDGREASGAEDSFIEVLLVGSDEETGVLSFEISLPIANGLLYRDPSNPASIIDANDPNVTRAPMERRRFISSRTRTSTE